VSGVTVGSTEGRCTCATAACLVLPNGRPARLFTAYVRRVRFEKAMHGPGDGIVGRTCLGCRHMSVW
jgi:hypothetical protein